MYQTLSEFLTTFSANSPILWTLLVMAVVTGTGVALYAFWEVLLKGIAAALRKGSNARGASSH